MQPLNSQSNFKIHFMQKSYSALFIFLFSAITIGSNAQVIISQYYEGNGTNKWIELTNMGTTAVNTASPQLKLGLWVNSGTTGNIKFQGSATQTVNLTVSIPAKGTVLIGNTANSTEVPYLTAASAAQTSNTVINFDGNDGIALLNSSNTVIDRFGLGINATNISYVRNSNVTAPTATFSTSQWSVASLTTVQTAATNSANRLGFHNLPVCSAPLNQASSLLFGTISSNSIAGSFSNSTDADGYMIVRSSSTTLSSSPIDGTVYSAGNSLGGGVVVASGTAVNFSATSLNSGSTYYFFIYAYKNTSCSGGPKYLTGSPLSGNATTLQPNCVAPSSQPTGLNFSAVTSSSMNASFSGSGANEYLVISSSTSTLSANPVNGTTYNAGNTIGGGTVINRGAATSFSLSGLNSNTTYYTFVFALNNTDCIGGPVYLISNPLAGNQTTLLPACLVPSAQPSALNFSSITSSSINGSFTNSGADEYLVISSTSPSLSSNPVNGVVYNYTDALGGGTVIGRSNSTSFSISGLNANTTYYFYVFALNNAACVGGPLYLSSNPLSGNISTTIANCTTPTAQPSGLVFSSITTSSMSGNFVGSGADEYLVVMSTNSSLSTLPVDGNIYNQNDAFGGGTVVQRNATTGFSLSGLAGSTNYYIFVFAINSNCAAGPAYLSAAPMSAIQSTNAESQTVLNFYNGNLHSHSSYSDGNADNTSRIPADDYAFAKTALCMDFLGISEHNHATAGMQIADWQPGIVQATAATTSNFVALHGMEWGIIGTTGSAGTHAGHMIVYGMDSLVGWETNNYQIYVPKSTYMGTGGLFEILNRHGGNALAYAAHPDNYDYNNILNVPYDVQADNAMIGSAVESGPAFSTDTTYTNQATSMSYFSFYKNMLAKGYHIGPTIDHDNHNYTFGHTAKSRLVIMAYSLTENNLLDAMRRLRFYASEDCGAKINFNINAQPLGSILRQAGSPSISVNTITTAAVSSIKLMYGVPGSGTAAVTLTSTTASSLNYTHTALANLATGYYFIDITETNGARIITAPIWYTRDDLAGRQAPATSFITINEIDRVILKWITTNETNNQQFEMERSADGRNFATIGSMLGKGKSTIANNYAIEDMNPIEGIAYYRLLQKDTNGKTVFSDLKVVDRGAIAKSYITVYPNPVHGLLNVKLVDTKNETSKLDLYDMAGRMVNRRSLNLIKGEQNILLDMSNLDNATYILKIRMGKQLLSKVVNKF